MLVFGLFCAGCGYLALATAPGVVVVAVSLFIAGFGAAFQHALSSAIIANTFRGAGMRTALGTYNSAGDIGKLAFTAFYSLAIGLGLAWQGVVVGFGLTSVGGSATVPAFPPWRSSCSWILPCRVVSSRFWHS